jgi:hypothetical protein
MYVCPHIPVLGVAVPTECPNPQTVLHQMIKYDLFAAVLDLQFSAVGNVAEICL